MGLRDLAKRLSASTDEVNQVRLQGRFCDVDVTKICDTAPRTPARICGEVAAIQVVPRAGSPSLEVTVDDGSGRAVAVFSGRKRIAGIEPGQGIVLEGVCRDQGGRLQLLNPAYVLLPAH
jgi:hypothetical protein